MAIASSDKLVVVKAFAPGNPLPLDAREIFESLVAAHEYAATSAVAYAGQTIKVVENGSVSAYNLVPSDEEGVNYKLQLIAGAGGAVQKITASDVDGNIKVTNTAGEGTEEVNVPVKGAIVNPVVDEDAHTLTLTKLGATPEQNEDVVIQLDKPLPETVLADVVPGEAPSTIKVVKFDVEQQAEVEEEIVVPNVFNDVTTTAGTDTQSCKVTFSYVDAQGDTQTKEIYETGVRKVEAGTVADKIKVTTADTDGTLTSSEILVGAGSVKNPTYDAETRKITLPVLQGDGTTQDLEINLGKDLVVKSGRYDEDTNEIVLVITDDSEIRIPASALVDIYTSANTETINVTVSDANEISATLKISAKEGNLIKVGEDGVYVSEDDFVATKKLITDAQTNAESHADSVAATAKSEANSYADGLVEAEEQARAEAVSSALTEAKGYTDTAKSEANSYADELVGDETEARTQAVADALAEAKAYADTAATGVSTTWVDFGSEPTA